MPTLAKIPLCSFREVSPRGSRISDNLALRRGIEPLLSAGQANVLPLNERSKLGGAYGYRSRLSGLRTQCSPNKLMRQFGTADGTRTRIAQIENLGS